LIRLAVFGKPVSHSLSPRIHGLFAGQFGLEVDYRAIETGPEDFPQHVRDLAREGGRGCNITVPLKREAWKLAARCSEHASRAEAANVLVFAGADWYADNTDGAGLVQDLCSSDPRALPGARICLLGAGGAAAGVLAALLGCEPEVVVIANRTVERARNLQDRHADLGAVTVCTPRELAAHAPFDVVINATSLGHSGSAPDIDAGWLSADGRCYDMNYGPAARALAQACEAKGIPYSDGLGMLVGQAALSFQLWTGELPDPRAVLNVLRADLGSN
jgi:shikimate dehydrogenase